MPCNGSRPPKAKPEAWLPKESPFQHGDAQAAPGQQIASNAANSASTDGYNAFGSVSQRIISLRLAPLNLSKTTSNPPGATIVAD